MDRTEDRAPIRVLVEHPNALVRLDLTEELQQAGFEVRSCPGPRTGPCPLLTGDGCPDAEGATVIVNALGGDRLEVYLGQRTLLPHTPICVDASDDDRAHLRGVLDDVRASGPIPTGSSLVDRIHEALDTGR